jgi:hypothetical protein
MAIVESEGELFVALCPELDIASQGATIQEARTNLNEAVELFLECAAPAEVAARRNRQTRESPFFATGASSGGAG